MKVTIREAIEAIRKNGADKIKNRYYKSTPNDAYPTSMPMYHGACAAGQGAYNLAKSYGLPFIRATKFESTLNLALLGINRPLEVYGREYTAIHALNDYTDLSLPQIADLLEKRAIELNVLDQEITL